MTSSTLHPGDVRAAWTEPVTAVQLVDDARARAFANLEIETVGDLLHHYPFRYLDFAHTLKLKDVRAGDEVTVVGRVHEVRVKQVRPKLRITEVGLIDDTGVLIGVWFNQPYVSRRFVEGEHVAFAGHVENGYGIKQMRKPYVEKLGAEDSPSDLGKILPIHKATEGLSTNWIRRLVICALEEFGEVADFLPSHLRLERNLLPLRSAITQMHCYMYLLFITKPRKRLAYDELFLLQLGLAVRRYVHTQETQGIAHVIDGPLLSTFTANIPVELTADQRTAVSEILSDMAEASPMNRLLLGDVGTGKTLVAAHAMCAAADSGGQAAMMAPTEVLALQYANALGGLLDASGISWSLLTGSVSTAERKDILERLASGEIQVAFGTHALIDSGVTFDRLTLSIVDEQHRFGVEQRIALREKGAAADLLVMTATPIPRSLAMTLYGDLAVSYLRERPHGTSGDRTTTRVVDKGHRAQAYGTVRTAVSDGRQAYIVCPLVEESEAAKARAAVDEAKRLAEKVFPDLKVGLLHGKMTSKDKADIMDRFRAGRLDVLVTTTVVEVGVDVPNATVMIVEDAERFGLAQLHQLRGRVGRGDQCGEVLLFADPKTPNGKERMAAIASTSDGFELADLDLKLRGQGELLGEKQHGLPDLRLASLVDDIDILIDAREDARRLVMADPHLQDPIHGPLSAELRERFTDVSKWVSSG